MLRWPDLCTGCVPTQLFCALHILSLCLHHTACDAGTIWAVCAAAVPTCWLQVCLLLLLLQCTNSSLFCTKYWLCCKAVLLLIMSWNSTSMLQGVLFDCSIASADVELYQSSACSLCLQPHAACAVCNNMAQRQASSCVVVGVLLLLNAQQCSQKQWMFEQLLLYGKLRY